LENSRSIKNEKLISIIIKNPAYFFYHWNIDRWLYSNKKKNESLMGYLSFVTFLILRYRFYSGYKRRCYKKRIKIRIDRSIHFIKQHINEFQIVEEDANIIANLIRFTGNIPDDDFFSMNDDKKLQVPLSVLPIISDN
jgi:hypothetical protein